MISNAGVGNGDGGGDVGVGFGFVQVEVTNCEVTKRNMKWSHLSDC